eukprot:231956_1
MSVWLFIEICSYLFGLVIVILCIYHNIQLWSRWNEMFIKKRYTFVVFLLNGTFIYCAISFYLLLFGHWFDTVGIVVAAANVLLALWCLFFLFILKNWMIYYRYNWTFHTIESKWQNIINQAKHQENWFIKNNTKYGSVRFMFKFIALWCSLGFILAIIPFILVIPFGFTVFIMILLVCLILLPLITAICIYSYIVKKTPNIDDVFFIHWESKMHSKWLKIFGIMCAIDAILGAIFSNTINNDTEIDIHDNGHKSWIFYPIIFAIIFYRMNYVSTNIISNKNSYQHIVVEETSLTLSASSPTCSENEIKKKIKIYMVLANEFALHEFMIHLSKEYSMECMLSVIEFQQYQNYILEHIDNKDDIKIEPSEILLLPVNVPISAIIDNDNDVNIPHSYGGDEFLFVAKIKAHKLYNKYVSSHCEYEINISYDERNKLYDSLHDLETLISTNINREELFWMFNNSKKEMISLLLHSFVRFKKDD